MGGTQSRAMLRKAITCRPGLIYAIDRMGKVWLGIYVYDSAPGVHSRRWVAPETGA
jgi:hypothetical protein